MSIVSKNSKLPQVALVGAGYWGKNLLRNLKSLGVLKAVCEINEDICRIRSKDYPDLKFLELEEILADTEIKGVVIAVPAEHHYKVAKQAMEAGKDVMVEKPITLSLEDAEDLLKISKEKKKILMVGHILLYHSVVEKLKSLIEKNELGRLQYIYSNRLNFGKLRSEENVLWSFAPHDISVILHLTGCYPDKITASGKSSIQSGIEDQVLVNFEYTSGLKGHIFVSWYNPFKEQKLVLIGEKQMAVFDDQAKDPLMLYPVSINRSGRVPLAEKPAGSPVSLQPSEPLKAECLHFLEKILDRKAPKSDGEEALQVLKFLHAAGDSLRKNNARL